MVWSPWFPLYKGKYQGHWKGNSEISCVQDLSLIFHWLTVQLPAEAILRSRLLEGIVLIFLVIFLCIFAFDFECICRRIRIFKISHKMSRSLNQNFFCSDFSSIYSNAILLYTLLQGDATSMEVFVAENKDQSWINWKLEGARLEYCESGVYRTWRWKLHSECLHRSHCQTLVNGGSLCGDIWSGGCFAIYFSIDSTSFLFFLIYFYSSYW